MNASARGALLLAVAVLLGFLVLRGAADNTQSLGTAGPVAEPTPTVAVELDPDNSAAVPTPEEIDATLARPNSEVRVLVANGTEVSGQASRLTTTLRNLGFNTREPRNADAQTTSTIFYRPGFASEAAVVRLELPGSAPVAMMPVPDPFIGDNIDLAPVDVLVLVGADDLSTS